jgi:hypothetical protein
MTYFVRLSALILIAALHAIPAGAQRGAIRSDPNCTYQACALGLAPVWNGLDVTRGDSQRRVATLGFFIPEDISHVFADDPEALGATGVARGLFRWNWDGLSTGLTLAGGASLAAGVPFQFAADGALSRAVWLFNRRYTR